MSVATALSRITGFARTWATAYALGLTTLAAAYTTANNIPNMIFELVAGGILSSLFIPTFMELRAQEGEERAWRFASHVFNAAVLSLGIVAVLGTLLPQPFIWTQTFRLPAERAVPIREAAEFFFRFFAVQVVIYGGGMVVQGLLNAKRRYLWPALGPVFNNLVVIATLVAVAWIGPTTQTGLIVLAAGTTLGVFAMYAVMVPDLIKSGIRYTPELGLRDPAVRRMLVLAVPTMLYVVTNLVAVSYRNASAFAVQDNGPSILMYAWNFYQLPYGVLGVALATAVFTELSATAGARDMLAFKGHFTNGLRMTGVLILPSAAILIALAEPLVSLYRIGAFQASNVAPVTSTLRLWGVSLIFYATMMYVLRAFYSLKDTLTPALIDLVFTVVRIGLYWALTTGVAGWAGLGIDGIPIADTVFHILMVAGLVAFLRRKIGAMDLRAVSSAFFAMTIASAAGGAVAYAIAEALGRVSSGVGGALLQTVTGALACFAVALAIGHFMGVEEVTSVTALFGRIIKKGTARR